MPFTPSHAVVALPFVRTRLVPAAIAVGAMTPDLPLFLRGTGLRYALTHDLRWLPVTVTVALVLLLVWRAVLRPAAGELLPRGVAARLPAEWRRGARASYAETLPPSATKLALLLVSLVLGILTHVVWDAFTHEGRVGSILVPALAGLWGPVPGYTWLQHGSSVVGLVILAAWGMRWLARREPGALPARVLPAAVRIGWWVSLPLVLLVAWGGGLAVLGPLTAEVTPAHLAYRVLPPACAVWAVLTVVLCVIVQLRRGTTRAGERDTPGRGR